MTIREKAEIVESKLIGRQMCHDPDDWEYMETLIGAVRGRGFGVAIHCMVDGYVAIMGRHIGRASKKMPLAVIDAAAAFVGAMEDR